MLIDRTKIDQIIGEPLADYDTTLSKVHTAMLLQSSGHTNALRTLIEAEQDRGPDFLRLANALSVLYGEGSNEQCVLDAVLDSVPE